MNGFSKFITSAKIKMFLLLLLNLAIYVFCVVTGYWYIHLAISLIFALGSIFFLSNKKERDIYKIIVFLLMLFLPIAGIGYAIIFREKRGNAKIRKEWAEIVYRNRKNIFQNTDTLTKLKETNRTVYKVSNYVNSSVGMPCYQNANIKYFNNGEDYYKNLFEECRNAKKYILLECHKIVPGKIWWELFDILRFKAREGVQVKLVYDDVSSTKYISSEDFQKFKNHGIETVPFNKVKKINSDFINCRNYKRICVIDGKIGFIGGFDISDEYVDYFETQSATKDCAVKLIGESVKNLIVMFFEDYQFASKKVINLQDYFVEYKEEKTKDWTMPYSTNPISLDNTNKNLVLALIYSAKESISITTTYLALDDELKNALIVTANSGIKVRIVFSGEKERKSRKVLAKSYFGELIKEGIEVYEYASGRMSTRLMLVDGSLAYLTTNNLDCFSTYKHFNMGIYVYGESTILMYNDMKEIINASQLITIKELQKRKFGEKVSAIWSKFLALFK